MDDRVVPYADAYGYVYYTATPVWIHSNTLKVSEAFQDKVDL